MVKKNNKNETVDLIIKNIGGFSNIVSASHCITRFRLVIKQKDLVKMQELEKIQEVKGVFFTQGQLHIVLGIEVNEYFEILINKEKFAEIDIVSKEKLNKISAKNLKWYEKMFIFFSDIFAPIIPALVAGGLILGFRNILETDWNGYVIKDRIAFFDGLNSFLWIPASAVFWYLPVGISYATFKKMNQSPILGIIIGLTLLVELPNIYSLTGKAGEKSLWIFNWISENKDFKFGQWHYPFKIGYTAQVIPALIIAFVGAYIEKTLKKVIPNILKQILVPLLTILISYTLAMTIIGPFGYIIGYAISEAIKWSLTNTISKYFFAPIIGLLYAPMVIIGIHHALNALMIQNTAQLGGSFVFPILAISNIAQGAAALAFVMLNKKDKKIREQSLSAFISCWLGVTEPAMYGINLKKIFLFFAAIFSSALGSLLLTIFGITSNGIGSGGIFGILSIQTKSQVNDVYTLPGSGFLWFAITMLVVIASTITLSFIFSKLKFFNKKLRLKNEF
ncbi:PTS transporter subunit EIIC [Mesomycoplasma neurolyticum]|uniref:EIIBC-Tre n=1 Tax=Mesomycoplasma neurolyticum TaxID=2120 RepID=A0A449A4L8_9BACT|nr:PTS transporter subunit EIIC [Mesomycoplasma neurolyticum]VEU59176.1 EIIBC-Tre [Mesomycoplasma neurolyticum]